MEVILLCNTSQRPIEVWMETHDGKNRSQGCLLLAVGTPHDPVLSQGLVSVVAKTAQGRADNSVQLFCVVAVVKSPSNNGSDHLPHNLDSLQCLRQVFSTSFAQAQLPTLVSNFLSSGGGSFSTS